MLQRQLTQEELEFLDDINDPVIFMDLLWYDRGYKMEDFQDARMILSEVHDEIVDTSCPETGKTFQLATRAYYFCGLKRPNTTSLFTAPRRVHLDPVVSVIEERSKNNPLAKLLLRKIVRHPEIQSSFHNESMLLCRIASTDGEAYFGIHPDGIVMRDEEEIAPHKSLDEIYSRMKAGCLLYCCGMINGDRQSVLYKVSHGKVGDFFLINVPRWKSSRCTIDQYHKILRAVGGKGSQEAKNRVFSLWGDPVSKLFDLDKIDKITRVDGNYMDIVVSKSDDKTDEEVLNGIVLPRLPVKCVAIMQTWDLGYKPDPSILGLWTMDDCGTWTLHQIIEIHAIDTIVQGRFATRVYNHYNRKVLLGFDFGYYGRGFMEAAIEAGYPQEKINPVEFNATMKIGEYSEDDEIDEDGNELTESSFLAGIRRPVKFWTTEHLIYEIDNSLISLPPISDEFDKEFAKAWQRKNPDGKMIYNSTDDHRISMLRVQAKIDFEFKRGWFPESDSDDMDDDYFMVASR